MADTNTPNDATPAGHPPVSGHPLVRDLVRSVAGELAPEELPVMAGLQGFDDATVVRRLGGRGRRREPLGFGAGDVAVLVIPVVWLVLNEVGQRMVNTTLDRTGPRVGAALRRLVRRPAAPVTVPPLSREQLAEVRTLVRVAAVERGLSASRAEVIADAVVTRLALAEAAEDESPEPSGTPAVAAAPQPPEAQAPPAPGTAPAGQG